MSRDLAPIPIETVILAGGQGSRLRAEVPKPLVAIDGQPLLYHLLQMLGRSGLDSFSIAVGHSASTFAQTLGLDCSAPAARSQHQPLRLPDGGTPRVRLLDTGEQTQTGGRLARLQPLLQGTFVLCWADGLSNVDLRAMLDFHRRHDQPATVLAVHPPARFGHLQLSGERVTAFVEKPQQRQEWINGGVFVLEPAILATISGDQTSFEHEVLPALAAADQLRAYRHTGYWQCMDTPAERAALEQLAASGERPWLVAT